MLVSPNLLKWTSSRRTLRRGTSGDLVRWVQQRLDAFGYEVGERDGNFGYLTEDALLNFQRDHRLRADGIAGPRVMAALRHDIPRQRIVHVVGHGERLFDLAQKYDISVNALRWMNSCSRRARPREGERLVVRSIHVLAGVNGKTSSRLLERALLSNKRLISSYCYEFLRCAPSGELVDEMDESFITLAGEGGWGVFAGIKGEEGRFDSIGEAMARRRSRQNLIHSLVASVKEHRLKGVFLDLRGSRYGLGSRLVRGIAALAGEMGDAKLILSVPPPLPGVRSLLSQVDYEKLSTYVDHIVLPLHHWETLMGISGKKPLDNAVLEGLIARATRRVPPWKILLGIPLGACSAREGHVVSLPYREAVAAAYRRRIRPAPWGAGFLRFSLDEEDGSITTYTLQGRASVARFIALAYRFRLGGVYLYPIGDEDRRFWDVLSHRIKAMPSV